jgi:hypothetical protein
VAGSRARFIALGGRLAEQGESFFDLAGLSQPAKLQIVIETRIGMRCSYCRQRAGLIRRTCPVCAKIIRIVEQVGGAVGLVGLVDIFAAEGLTRAQVDRVLDAQVAEQPTLRDRLTSDMTNVLMRGLGMPGRQSPEDVRRVRRSMQASGGEGTWRGGEKPPGMS